jgi:hypothetical protein
MTWSTILVPLDGSAISEAAARDPLQRYLDDVATGPQVRGIAAATRIVVGSPVDQILATAGDVDAPPHRDGDEWAR